MRYIRKFNESNQSEITFNEFKQIMFEILDDFEFEYKFNDFSNSEGPPFYDCWITVNLLEEYAISDDQPNLNFDYLGYQYDILPPVEEMENINDIFEKVDDAIKSQVSDLYALKNNLDSVIKSNEDMKNIFKLIQTRVLPRFEEYDNFLQSDIGFDSTNAEIRITFEIKTDNDEER